VVSPITEGGALGFGSEADPGVLGFCFEEADNGNL
jgi:hypothetical protein